MNLCGKNMSFRGLCATHRFCSIRRRYCFLCIIPVIHPPFSLNDVGVWDRVGISFKMCDYDVLSVSLYVRVFFFILHDLSVIFFDVRLFTDDAR